MHQSNFNRRFFCTVFWAGALRAQTSSDEEVYQAYVRFWSEHGDLRTAPQRYREKLLSDGMPPAEVSRRISIITERSKDARWREDQIWKAAASDPENVKRRLTPNAWLVECAKGIKPGKALDLGMGEGRNSLYLAGHGWDVTGVDFSDFAVAVARQQAQQSGITYTSLAADLDTWEFGHQLWDLVVSTWEPDLPWARKIVDALKPGGLLVREAGIGSMNEEALRKAFAPLRILRLELRLEDTNDFKAAGGSAVSLRVARMVAEKQ